MQKVGPGERQAVDPIVDVFGLTFESTVLIANNCFTKARRWLRRWRDKVVNRALASFSFNHPAKEWRVWMGGGWLWWLVGGLVKSKIIQDAELPQADPALPPYKAIAESWNALDQVKGSQALCLVVS
jgi:hypothetical protein